MLLKKQNLPRIKPIIKQDFDSDINWMRGKIEDLMSLSNRTLKLLFDVSFYFIKFISFSGFFNLLLELLNLYLKRKFK